MKKVKSAPCLSDLAVAPGAAAAAATPPPRSLAVGRLTPTGMESRVVGDALKNQGVGQRGAASVTPLPWMLGNTQLTTTRPSVRTSAVALPDVGPVVMKFSRDLSGLARTVQDEVVVESGLHVVGVAAGGCYERFGISSKLAPPLAPLGRGDQKLSDEDMELAICMATPFEGGDAAGLTEEVQRSLDDLALDSEIRFDFEWALDCLAEMALSDSDERALRPVRTRRRQLSFKKRNSRRERPSKDVWLDGKENEAGGNIVPFDSLKKALREVKPQS